jgi:hypothetical protein
MADAILMAAIKKRKEQGTKMGDHVDMSHASQHTDDADKDLHGIVASLSDDQKGKLKGILDNHMADSMGIAKGNPSSEEQGHIADAAKAESQTNSLMDQDGGDGHISPDQSDEIAKSMLDSRHLGENPPTGKPRNLGERMKMSVMNKLKTKGKI